MNKIVIIINGTGSVGKDTLCKLASKHFKVKNISSITPIKEIAKYSGWDGSKDSKSRKFLSDLKQLIIDYNDLPFKYIKWEYNNFIADDNEILFIHIREANEIDKVKNHIGHDKCNTLLIVGKYNKLWGNTSDDCVDNYNYDYIFENNSELEIIEIEFCKFLEQLLRR